MAEVESREGGALWGLYYALYHAPLVFWERADLPAPVVRAYIEVQDVLQGRVPGVVDPVTIAAASVDPLKYVERQTGDG